ncbi:Fungal Zn(2)-Cys(6) binuclear cluster domain-containing protein [Penicillium ucsense]|uniref:Fungal Zn(2)-Cys(6) binuclear cluster domain-containing protein n=1 Tax=Penicillium ucsense TaxID=2839758 RepID=A0A8J8W559_9EURO|nr:Fungal Zn(2)-Cys(6) binuclear cluster domain-containing protein [Penicillium ucsense]KAF7737858.1 Fungal Zn(2)-Cys(6) binuclear cluster domain-containing protein [Penicillium ucsense]
MSRHPDVDPLRRGHYPPPPEADLSRQGQYPPPPPPDDRSRAYPYDQQHHYPYPQQPYPAPPEHDRGYYPPPPPGQYQAPPPPQQQHMAAIHPHAPPDYRLPPPPGAYRPDPYQQPPPQQQPMPYHAAAPRQRTAIACRYCRRRKIRCSGFENSPDGRCTNCQRFNQDCMFTPVSSQAQAFVPAHAAYPHMRPGSNVNGQPPPGTILYGAHGQPLPPNTAVQAPETTLPPPQGMYAAHYGRPAEGAQVPLAQPMADPRQRRGSGTGFDYPEPANLAPVTPASSTPGYQTHTAPSPYYALPHDPRTSPQATYAYEQPRHSTSPHSPYAPITAPPPGQTPPPTSTPGGSQRGGLNVRDILNHGADDSQGRSSTDSDMLNQLNRRGPR